MPTLSCSRYRSWCQSQNDVVCNFVRAYIGMDKLNRIVSILRAHAIPIRLLGRTRVKALQ